MNCRLSIEDSDISVLAFAGTPAYIAEALLGLGVTIEGPHPYPVICITFVKIVLPVNDSEFRLQALFSLEKKLLDSNLADPD
jgi:hypothetical protein